MRISYATKTIDEKAGRYVLYIFQREQVIIYSHHFQNSSQSLSGHFKATDALVRRIVPAYCVDTVQFLCDVQ